jgi:hypothetical protein
MIFPQPFPTAESSEPQLILFDLVSAANNQENNGVLRCKGKKTKLKIKMKKRLRILG